MVFAFISALWKIIGSESLHRLVRTAALVFMAFMVNKVYLAMKENAATNQNIIQLRQEIDHMKSNMYTSLLMMGNAFDERDAKGGFDGHRK